MSPKLQLDEGRAIASRVPSREVLLTVAIEGPEVGTWAIDHQDEDLRPFFLAGGGPQFTVRVAGGRSCGPAYLGGYVELKLIADRAEFANSFEAAQLALDRLSQLPDARHLAHTSLRIEVDKRIWE